jgi:hypothetical protein
MKPLPDRRLQSRELEAVKQFPFEVYISLQFLSIFPK